jgi:hypothetical protein
MAQTMPLASVIFDLWLGAGLFVCITVIGTVWEEAAGVTPEPGHNPFSNAADDQAVFPAFKAGSLVQQEN